MTDTVMSWIEERRAALRNDEKLIREDRAQDAFHEFPRALNALEQVLAVHKPVYLVSGGERKPGYCKECYSSNWSWPCATVQAIEGAINE